MAMIGETVVGTCGNCGGEVVLPDCSMSVLKPVPTCNRCGATAKTSGPVIPMNPAPRRTNFIPDRNDRNSLYWCDPCAPRLLDKIMAQPYQQAPQQ